MWDGVVERTFNVRLTLAAKAEGDHAIVIVLGRLSRGINDTPIINPVSLNSIPDLLPMTPFP
jgi:hypothetical protein